MNSSSPLRLLSPRLSRRALQGLAVFSAVSLFPICVLAQDAPPPAEAPPPADGAAAPADNQAPADGTRTRKSDTRSDGTPRRQFDPTKMMDNLRKRLDVTDDGEWALISARLTTVFQLRMASGGMGGFRPGGGGGQTRGGGGAEVDSLREAIDSKLPDAEIKARLERVREVRKANDAKLDKAREDLRAVLTVRQEAFLVMMGMLN